MEIKVPNFGEEQNPRCLKFSVFTIGDDLGWHVICWCWSIGSTVNAGIYQEILELFMLLSADKLYGGAKAPAGLSTWPLCQTTTNWFTGHCITVLDWSANPTDLNLIRYLWRIVKRKMRNTDPKVQMS